MASSRYAVRAPRGRVEHDDRLPERRRLREPHRARDHRLVHLVAEVLAHLGLDLLGEPGARVVHREHDPPHVERRVERPDQRHVAEQLAETLERVVLALDRHDHVVGRGEPVHREQAERRRAVDEHDVVLGADEVERPLELELAAERGHELDLGAGEVDGRGEHEEVLEARRLDAVERGHVVHEHVVDRALDVAGVDAEPGRRVALRVEVDHQHPEPELGERRAEVDGGGRLADATLLVGDRDHPGERELARLRLLDFAFTLGGAGVGRAESAVRGGSGRRPRTRHRRLRRWSPWTRCARRGGRHRRRATRREVGRWAAPVSGSGPAAAGAGRRDRRRRRGGRSWPDRGVAQRSIRCPRRRCSV